MIPSLIQESLPFRSRFQAGILDLSWPCLPCSRVRRTRQTVSAARPSALIDRFSRRSVQTIDSVAMLAALLVTLGNSPFARRPDLTAYPAMGSPAHNLVIDASLLLVWRVCFWLIGIYEPGLSRRATALFWRLPLTTGVCAVALWPVLCAKRLADETPHSVPFFFVLASVLLLAMRGILVVRELRFARGWRTALLVRIPFRIPADVPLPR